MTTEPINLTRVEDCVDEVIRRVGKNIVIGIPLGLGKPNQFVNALYQRAKQDKSIQLKILTALSLEKPRPKNELEAKFLVPFVERLFADYEELDYMKAIREDALPDNICVSEFYFKAGSMKGVGSAQSNYISSNYNHAARDMIDNGINVLAQLVAERTDNGTSRLSLSSNTDITLDLIPMLESLKAQGHNYVTVAQVHDDLPFMVNSAEVKPDYFDLIIRNPKYSTTLFAPPNMSVPAQDYLIGLYASALIADGGTLQIGVGSLSDAIVYACKLRHQNNATYQELYGSLQGDLSLCERVGGVEPFSKGLYGSSEMFVNGFVHLIEAGIIKRKVYDDLQLQQLLNSGAITENVDEQTVRALVNAGVIGDELRRSDIDYLKHWGIFTANVQWKDGQLIVGGDKLSANIESAQAFEAVCRHCLGTSLKNGIYMHGGFFLGPRDFYQKLRDMPEELSRNICMSSIGHINQLDYDYDLLSAQRKQARFINTGMMVTLGGAVVSDGLEDGTVVSGVGGQYNFVAMGHALPDARSILCIRSSRGSGKDAKSNIVAHYGHITIPRHLRDIIITEYGIADLRGKCDADIIKALLNVTDSRFQGSLLKHAKSNRKIEDEYQVPQKFRENNPENIQRVINNGQAKGLFPKFPLGTDFTDEEIALSDSLSNLKARLNSPRKLARGILRSFILDIEETEAQRFLQRMQMENPDTAKETIIQHLLLLELEENGYLKAL